MNMLYWRSKGIDTLIAHGVEITTRITDLAHGTERSSDAAAALSSNNVVSFQEAAFFLCQLSVEEGD